MVTVTNDKLGGNGALAEQQLAIETIAVLDSSSVVDTFGGTYSESDTIQTSLTETLAHTVVPFTDLDATSIAAAVAGRQVLVFPEMEQGSLVSQTDEAAETVIRDFVEGGGTLMLSLDNSGRGVTALNEIFGFSLISTSARTSALQPEAVGTTFEGGPVSLPRHSATMSIPKSTLPTGAISIYGQSDRSTVAVIPFGEGQITVLGWDWFNAAPLGALDGGWLDVLGRAISARGDGAVTDADSPFTFDQSELLANDTDAEGDPLTVTAVGPTSALGATVTLNADGTITYDPTGAAGLAGLAEGDKREDTLTYTVSDGTGDSDIGTVTLAVAGIDAPPIQNGTVDDIVTGDGADFSFQVPADLFTDPKDRVLTYDARQADGSALPGWLKWNSDTRTLGFEDVDVGAAQAGTLQLRLTATERDGQSSSTTFNFTFDASQIITGTAGDDSEAGGGGADVITGFGGKDTLHGGPGDDEIDGGADKDRLRGGVGDDTLMAGDGDDTARGDAGDDSILGGANHDCLTGDAGMDTLRGGQGEDTLEGGTDRDLLDGGSENDLLKGNGGRDTLEGGFGDDTLRGGGSDDRMSGDDGDDLLVGGVGNDILRGGLGDDSLDGEDDRDLITGEGGSDTLNGGAGRDTLDGGSGADLLNGGGNHDHGFGQGGYDTLNGGAGNDSLMGGSGHDDLFGDTGNDTLFGETGKDRLFGGDGRDSLGGGDGADHLEGNDGDDTLRGGLGSDHLNGGANDDDLQGHEGDDTLTGEGGADDLRGGEGDDSLLGGTGHDTLRGGEGDDTMTGGSGRDKHVVKENFGADVITDFSVADGDILDLSRVAAFTTLADLVANHLRDNGGSAEIFDGTNTLLLQGISVSDIGAGQALDLGTIVFADQNLFGDGGNNTLEGGDGNDGIFGRTGDDSLIGNAGDDTLDGQIGNDTLDGGDGRDRLQGGHDGDILNGGADNDLLYGDFVNSYSSRVTGAGDTLNGATGDDTLLGSRRDDVLSGGDGNDKMNGRAGNDTLEGGAGIDTFVFNEVWGQDTLRDFSADDAEKINLNGPRITDFTDLITNHLRDNGGQAEIFDGTNTLLLEGVTVAEIGLGLAYSDQDFSF